jgi:hypothetical protein
MFGKLTERETASNLGLETAMPETAELQKSTGGYMSVDPAAAIQRNQELIDNLRQAFQESVRNPEAPGLEPPTQPLSPNGEK